MIRLLIMAAGTGGHVYPALAVAERLRTRGVEVMWLGTRTGIEARLVPAAGFSFHVSQVAGLRGKRLRRRAAAPFSLLRSGMQVFSLLSRLRPHAVLGMGGYGAGPGGIASKLLRIPLVIHEQNAVPGLTNRLLAPLANRILEAFPGTFDPRRQAIHTGNPVREELLRMRSSKAPTAFEGSTLRLLVLGGSQGARSLNEAVPKAIARLLKKSAGSRPDPADPSAAAAASSPSPPSPPAFEIRHQCGPAHIAATDKGYLAQGLEAQVSGYVEDMSAAYSWADLVICRAGAMTLAELAVAGVASILVPFPFAVDDHQRHNANHLVRRGAALCLAERPASAASGSEREDERSERLAAALVDALEALVADRSRLRDMARAAYEAAVPDATARVVACCLEAASRRAKGGRVDA